MKILIGLGVLILLLVVVYFSGPKPAAPVYVNTLPEVPAQLTALETYINQREAKLPVKTANEARIVWADSTHKEQTEYVLIYLHGFTASQGEGEPVHRDFAEKFGCNLYLSRLAGHGLKGEDAMLEFTPDKLWASTLEAYAIGKKLGKKVILMGTSTGGALALRLAANFPEIKGVILYSPNIAIKDGSAWLTNKPWGLQLIRKVMGGMYSKKSADKDPKVLQYWYSQYRLEAVPQLQEFIETSNTRQTYEQVKQPVLMLYYYKDEQHQDKTVRVDAMLKMFDELGTPVALKVKSAIPEAGTHVIASPLLSKGVQAVESKTFSFATDILGMKAVPGK